MPITLKISLVATDMLFIFYWLMAGFSALGIIAIPAEMMYADYNEPRVGAIS